MALRWVLCFWLAASCSRHNPDWRPDFADLSVVLGAPGDLAVGDLASPADLAWRDLGAADLAQGDLWSADLAQGDLAPARDLATGDLGGCTSCCSDDDWGKGCAAASSLGSIAVTGSQSITGVLPLVGEENWFQVTFPDATSAGYHPKVALSSLDGDVAFDVSADVCGGGELACGEGGAASSIGVWEVSHPGGASAPGCAGSDMGECLPQPVGSNGTIRIRVHRLSTAATCSQYLLTVSD